MLKVSELRKNEETAKAGKKWLPEEDSKLIQEVTDKKTYDEIALEHKRTIGAIKCRVISHVIYVKYKDGNTNIDELASEYNIEKEMLERQINKIEATNAIKQAVEQNSYETKGENEVEPRTKRKVLLEKIASIEDKMIIIEQKLDQIISIITK